ncbi:hypothetical protein K4A83_09850 [Spirulina subsalsa FACHB-351]|uniref:Transporter n=1 Tax=Spirulina subsalsa FACHB-351 TaxID=234711 RepID=A0ABT3L4Y7_9CYAN|nr:hypothetical protein [Spirulina subsalsa]MCW6036563.1 hypothetical protein [Spirulina subsalsa FACHB-351]
MVGFLASVFVSQGRKAGGVVALFSVIFGAVDPVWGNPSSPPLQTLGNASKQWITQASAPPSTPLDIEPEILDESPVLQRWSEEIPDVLHDIRHDPSFKTRVRLGYSQFPSTHHRSGWTIGVEDVFLGKTGLTVSAEYQGTFKGDRTTWGGDLRYYVLPLGSRVNIAPVLGYRNITTGAYQTDGINVGAKLKLIPSRTGAADLSLTQTFVSPGSSDEVGITTLSVGYAITPQLRISTDLQKQNSVAKKDSRVGIILEWMP